MSISLSSDDDPEESSYPPATEETMAEAHRARVRLSRERGQPKRAMPAAQTSRVGMIQYQNLRLRRFRIRLEISRQAQETMLHHTRNRIRPLRKLWR